MLTVEEKNNIVKQFATSANDTGSPEVQVALLTHRITKLTPHFAKHKHDFSSKQGLMKLIGQRKALLQYLERKSTERYQKLIKALGLRK